MIVELTAPLGSLQLFDTALQDGSRVAFEQQAAVAGSSTPSLRMPVWDEDSVREQLERSTAIDELRVVSESDDERLVTFEWDSPPPPLLATVADVDASVLSAVAVENTWRFRLRVPDQQDNASRLFEVHEDSDNVVTVDQVRQDESASRDPVDSLTRPQREALERAIDGGYFQVPRNSTIADLAADLDISDTAVSQRLRRGLSTVIRSSESLAVSTRDAEVRDD